MAKPSIVPLTSARIDAVVGLQRACFPAPFDESLLWRPEHLAAHLERFPEGQFVALDGDQVIGSASAARISEAQWDRRADWTTTLGGPTFEAHDPTGTTLYGADISVHPEFRRAGVGRALYAARFDLVTSLGLTRFGTACRIPDWSAWAHKSGIADKSVYVEAVARGLAKDRTLSPLLKMGLRLICVIENYMEDEESGDAAAELEWTP